MFCLLDVPPFLFVQKTKAEEHVVSGYYEIPEHPSLEKVATDISKEGLYEELRKPEELFRQISNIQQQQQQQQQQQSDQGEHSPLVKSKQKEQEEQPCFEETKDCTREGFYEEFDKPREYLHLVNNNNNNNQHQQLEETENTYEPVGSSVIRVYHGLWIAGNLILFWAHLNPNC